MIKNNLIHSLYVSNIVLIIDKIPSIAINS